MVRSPAVLSIAGFSTERKSLGPHGASEPALPPVDPPVSVAVSVTVVVTVAPLDAAPPLPPQAAAATRVADTKRRHATGANRIARSIRHLAVGERALSLGVPGARSCG